MFKNMQPDLRRAGGSAFNLRNVVATDLSHFLMPEILAVYHRSIECSYRLQPVKCAIGGAGHNCTHLGTNQRWQYPVLSNSYILRMSRTSTTEPATKGAEPAAWKPIMRGKRVQRFSWWYWQKPIQ